MKATLVVRCGSRIFSIRLCRLLQKHFSGFRISRCGHLVSICRCSRDSARRLVSRARYTTRRAISSLHPTARIRFPSLRHRSFSFGTAMASHPQVATHFTSHTTSIAGLPRGMQSLPLRSHRRYHLRRHPHQPSNQSKLEPTAGRCEVHVLSFMNSSQCCESSPPPAVAQLRLVRRMRTRAASTISILAAFLALVSCGSHITRIRKDSPLYLPVVQIAPHDSWEQRVRDAVLQQLPIGSTRDQMQAFLHKHFVRVQYAVTHSDDSRALAPSSEPHVFIRAIDDTGFPGECRVEIYLLLTSDEHLKDVVVRATEAYV